MCTELICTFTLATILIMCHINFGNFSETDFQLCIAWESNYYFGGTKFRAPSVITRIIVYVKAVVKILCTEDF